MLARSPLSDSAFVVLALLAEAPAHGYDLRKKVLERGFQFWTRLERTAIYNALLTLERQSLVTARSEKGTGRPRKVYRLTARGHRTLRNEGLRHLASPLHPRHELDLGLYALPFLPPQEGRAALDHYMKDLEGRRAFLRERHQWCLARGLTLPALAFERPLLALESEMTWLQRVVAQLESGQLSGTGQWARYEYRHPLGLTGGDADSPQP